MLHIPKRFYFNEQRMKGQKKKPSCNNLIITYILTLCSHDRSRRSTNKLNTNIRTIIHQYAHPILTKT